MHSDDDHPVVSIRPVVRTDRSATAEPILSVDNFKAETSAKESYVSTVAFYDRLGCEKISRIKDVYDVEDDKLTMAKRFS
jgi:hypothetical protein